MLSPALWAFLLDFARQQTQQDALTAAQRSAYRQTAFILTFAYQTGLRLQELVNARLGDLKRYTHTDAEQWWLQVLGKGNKLREIPISQSLLAAIQEQLDLRKVGTLGTGHPDVPIIGQRRAGKASTPDDTRALSASSVYKRLKRFFEQAAEQLQTRDPIGAEQLKKASTHWLRHTHGSNAVEKGVPLEIVRDNLGHSSIATTSIYIHTDKDRRYQLMTEHMS